MLNEVKSNTKGQILHDFTYMRSQSSQMQIHSGRVGARSWMWGGGGLKWEIII